MSDRKEVEPEFVELGVNAAASVSDHIIRIASDMVEEHGGAAFSEKDKRALVHGYAIGFSSALQFISNQAASELAECDE